MGKLNKASRDASVTKAAAGKTEITSSVCAVTCGPCPLPRRAARDRGRHDRAPAAADSHADRRDPLCPRSQAAPQTADMAELGDEDLVDYEEDDVPESKPADDVKKCAP